MERRTGGPPAKAEGLPLATRYCLHRDGVRIVGGYQPRTDRLEDHLIVLDRRYELAAFLPALTDRQLDPVVDHSLEESSAIRQAVALLHQFLERLGFDRQGLVPTLQRAADLLDVLERDFAHL